MNDAIRRELDKLNEATMANGETRRALFEANKRATSAELSTHHWKWGEWTIRKVARNCHVSVERNYYSGPSAHIDRAIEVRMSERMIEVFLQRGVSVSPFIPERRERTAMQRGKNICQSASKRCSTSVLRTMVTFCSSKPGKQDRMHWLERSTHSPQGTIASRRSLPCRA